MKPRLFRTGVKLIFFSLHFHQVAASLFQLSKSKAAEWADITIYRYLSPRWSCSHNKRFTLTCCRAVLGDNPTAPTLSGDPKYFSWGPNGDLILSEMGTQWGPSTAEMGTQKAYIWKIDRNEVIRWNKDFFWKNIHRGVSSFSAQCLCHLYWINSVLSQVIK